jgi:hypothetical protein
MWLCVSRSAASSRSKHVRSTCDQHAHSAGAARPRGAKRGVSRHPVCHSAFLPPPSSADLAQGSTGSYFRDHVFILPSLKSCNALDSSVYQWCLSTLKLRLRADAGEGANHQSAQHGAGHNKAPSGRATELSAPAQKGPCAATRERAEEGWSQKPCYARHAPIKFEVTRVAAERRCRLASCPQIARALGRPGHRGTARPQTLGARRRAPSTLRVREQRVHRP